MLGSPLIKYFIVAVFCLIVISLGAAFYHLMRDRGGSDKTLRALTVRMSLSVALFLVIMLLYATGVLQA